MNLLQKPIAEDAESAGIFFLGLYLSDGSFWERRHIDGLLYRHDHAPHIRWKTSPLFQNFS
jgi:hypothetical protein